MIKLMLILKGGLAGATAMTDYKILCWSCTVHSFRGQQWQWNAISRNNIKIVIIVCESEFQHLMKMSIKSVCLELMGMPEILNIIIMFYV